MTRFLFSWAGWWFFLFSFFSIISLGLYFVVGDENFNFQFLGLTFVKIAGVISFFYVTFDELS